MALSLNKANEVFVKAVNEHDMPLKFLSPGRLFGLFEVANLLSGFRIDAIWSVSSGARNIFMLPKITDKLGYQRLKKELNITIDLPRALADHWRIFKLISNHPAHIQNWSNTVIFFTNSWFENSYNNPKWASFYNYLFRESILQTRFTEDDAGFNLAWQYFAAAIGSRHLRPRPYILNTLRHLIAVAAGILPGFRPADASELAAPTRLLQNLYTDIYGLKHYLPTMMHVHNLMPGQELRPLYYSLAFPFVFQELFMRKPNVDILADTREIKLLFNTLYAATQISPIHLPTICHLISHVHYQYFHSGPDIYNEIQPAGTLATSDPSMISDKIFFKDRRFCASAPFLSGCIQIMRQSHFAL